MQAEFSSDSLRAIVQRIVSGGQTGADRGALDAAIELGIAHGGWVPRDRWAEDGPLPAKYQVQETPTGEIEIRTEWNVRDSDATLLCTHGTPHGGSALTRRLARRYRKPLVHVDFEKLEMAEAVEAVRQWLVRHRPAVLNIAGSRASTDARIYERVRELLFELLGRSKRRERET